MSLKGIKLITLIIFCLGMISLVSADSNFRIQAVDESFSMNKTGVNTSTVQLVKIEYANPGDSSWEPINQKTLKENTDLLYYYNSTKGNAAELNYLGMNYNGSGYWYAKFKPNQTRGNMIKYNASGSVNHSEGTDVFADDTANLTEDLRVGDIEVRINNQIDDVFKAGKSINVEVKAWNTNEKNYFNDSEGSVEVSFANASGEATSTGLDNYNDGEDYFHNGQVKIPDSTGSTYLMHVDVTPDSGSSPKGTFSKIVKTHPSLRGKISHLNSNTGCINEDRASGFDVFCEQGAEVSAEYDITSDSANEVNLTTYSFNSSGSEKLDDVNLDRSDDDPSIFTGSADIPDLNSSEYSQGSEFSKVEFVFNSSNQESYHVDRKNVSLVPFRFEDEGSPTASLGEEYNLELFLSKPFSNQEYDLSRFENISVNVTDPSGQRVAYLNKSNLTYENSRGLIEGSFTLGSDMESGPYSLEGEAYNIYGDRRILDSSPSFYAENTEKTFNISNADLEVNTLWSKNYSLDIENLVSQENNISITNELPEEIDLLNESVKLKSQEEDFLKFEVNLSTTENISGDLILTDNETDYNKTVEISANAADCKHVSGKLCSLTKTPIEAYISNSSENVIKIAEILNVGPSDQDLEVDSSVNGNISDYLSITAESDFNLSDERTIFMNFTAGIRGNFTGDLSLDTGNETLQINTSLEANITQTEEENVLTVDPTSFDLGYIPEGDIKSADVELTNDGDETLSEITASSNIFTVSVSDSEDLDAGESVEMTLDFEDVRSENGNVTVSAGGNEVSVAVSAEPVPDYSDKADDDLRKRLQNLEEQETTTGQDEDLTGVSTKIEEIESAWDAGNYEEAQTLYNDADDKLETISDELVQDEDESNGNGDNNTSEGGGIPIIPVAGGIFAIILILFVILTSYVPEKGDPLYSLMGE